MDAVSLVKYMASSFGLTNVNWAKQVGLAKQLLSKFSYSEILYAINYYKTLNANMYSLGFLLYGNNMKNPVSLFHAEMNTQESANSGERNRNRIEQLRKAQCGKEPAGYLFAESGEDN